MIPETSAPAKRMPLADGVGLQPLVRSFSLRADTAAGVALDQEARTLTITFSSEQPVDRWFGEEILAHDAGSARLDRLNDGAPLLFNHDMDDVIGVVEQASIGGDRKGHAVVRFAKTPRGDEMMGMVADGILRNVSFMYRVYEYKATVTDPDTDGDDDTYTGTDWEPFEISLVTVPADPTVGVGRAAAGECVSVRIQRSLKPTATAGTSQPGDHMKHVLQNATTDTGGAGGGGGGAATIDIKAERQAAAEGERQRIAGIEALGKAHKLKDEVVRGLIQKGASIEEARGVVLDELIRVAQSPVASLSNGSDPDLTDKEKANYSMIRAINACINKDWTKAGFELECSKEVARLAKRDDSAGFFMPMNIPFYTKAQREQAQSRAQYQVSGAATGGVLVATQLLAGSFIEILRNRAKVFALGATFLTGLQGNVDLPRRSGAGVAYWVGDAQAPTEAESTFEKLGLTPKTIGAYSIITRNMLMQATPDIEALARADMMAIIALGLDAGALYGTGAGGQPMGITNTSGIGAVVGGTNGAAVTIDNLIDLETQVTAGNAPEDTLAYLANAKTVGSLKKLKASTGQYLWTQSTFGERSGTPGEINGYPVSRSNQCRSNLVKGSSGAVCSEIFYGAWSELIIGEWGVLEVVPNPYGAAYKSGGVELRALQTVDIGTRHPVSFSVMSDALTP
jgi:HK97 family phage major capsid protein/HK97 family phage prohead protease